LQSEDVGIKGLGARGKRPEEKKEKVESKEE
jgi:hypothetical protein